MVKMLNLGITEVIYSIVIPSPMITNMNQELSK